MEASDAGLLSPDLAGHFFAFATELGQVGHWDSTKYQGSAGSLPQIGLRFDTVHTVLSASEACAIFELRFLVNRVAVMG